MTSITAPSPIILAGTTGDLDERRFCQFWGPVKVSTLPESVECVASMDSSGGGLRVDARCPQAWLAAVWAAYCLILAGGTPDPTHTAVFNFGKPTFTALPALAASAPEALFDIEETTR